MKIDGKTSVIAHLAYPSTHLRTPSFFNPLIEKQGRNAVLVPWQVHPDNLKVVMDALRLSESVAGVIVTIPHKTAVAELCDELVGPARFLGVANVARLDKDRRYVGTMFDGSGYIRGLANEGHDLSGKSVLLLGAGGAATGIAHAALEAGAARLVIANRTEAKAADLAKRLNAEFGDNRASAGPADATGFDVVINGTSVGMKDKDPYPVDPDTLAPGTLVGEVIMQPAVTPLLNAAKARGCTIHKGEHMITGQTELLAEFLLGPA